MIGTGDSLFLEIVSSVLVFSLLIASAGLGLYLRPRLPETHRRPESLDMVRIVTGMLVTVVALVIGMLLASVKNAYDATQHDLAAYATEIEHLDNCMRDLSPEADPLREKLRSYTAGVIMSTWPQEKPPVGASYPDLSSLRRSGPAPVLGKILTTIGRGLRELPAPDGGHARQTDYCRDEFNDVLHARASLTEDRHNAISLPFYRLLVGWLCVVFLSFGLSSPRNGLAYTAIVLCALALSSALFAIQDLDHPYTGIFYVSSERMRSTLDELNAP